MRRALRRYLQWLFFITALAAPVGAAVAGPLPPGVVLQHGSRSFTTFPDKVVAGLSNPDHFLQQNWSCASAEVFTFEGGSQLAICGSVTPLSSRAHSFLVEPGPDTDFSWVVSRNTTGMTELMFVGGGWAANPTLIEVRGPESLSYIEALEDDSRYFSLFATPVTCGDSCRAGAQQCDIDIPRTLYRDAAAKAQGEKVKSWNDLPPEKQRDDTYTDLMTTYSHRLLMRALVGDSEAAALLLKPPFELDGAPAEIWDSDTETYRRAQRLGCVEPAIAR